MRFVLSFRQVARTAAATVLAAGLAVAQADVAQDRMSPELLWQLTRVSDPQLSPDGKTLLYHARTYDLAANRGTTQLVMLDLESRAERRLTTVGSNSNGRWSADGKSVAFVSSRDGSSQIYIIDIDGGEARRVTDHSGGVSFMAWSPTGEHFSFTSAVKLDPDVHDLYPDLPEAEAQIYDDLMIRHWDTWKDGTYSHLFVVPAAGGEARDLLEGQRIDTPLKPFGGGEQIAWSPDGREICFVAKVDPNPEASTNSDLWVVKVDGSDSAPVRLTEGMPGYEINPSYSPDGSKLAFESMARNGYESDRNRLFVMDRGADTSVEVTKGWDLTSADYVWHRDGQGFYILADTRGTRQIFSVGVSGASVPEPLTTGRVQYSSPVPGAGGTLYALRAQTERPYEVVSVAADGTSQQLTDANGEVYESLELPSVEERWFEATDGKQIHAWIVKPPNFDPNRRYPMLTYCQGGPQSQVGQWFSYRWNFHLMAAQGYIVLAVNRRGLPGFGVEWNEQISRDWGGQAMNDLLSATDQMFDEPYVDREHTAAIGASFGGYSVYWLMGHDEPNRFCTMIAHCGVFHLESMYLSTEEQFFVNWDLGGAYWKSPEIARDYRRFSPSSFLQNWDTPLLVIHGQKDFRVPVEQGIQAFTGAQLQGVPSRFVYFPDEGHWVQSPQNGVLWHRLFFNWLDRWCKK